MAGTLACLDQPLRQQYIAPMPDKRIPRKPGSRRVKRGKQRKTERELRFDQHPLFGKIPIIPVSIVALDGKVYERWGYDPSYKPSMPRGAIRGDIRKQVYCHDTPRYFYVDEDRECIQCGRTFVFHGKEQKYWYEVMQFTLKSVPIRCLECRRQRRSEHAMREAIAKAKRDAVQGDPAAQLALARAIVEYHERTQNGNLDEAIAAARKAAALLPV